MPIDATQNNAIISIYLVELLVPTGKTSLSTNINVILLSK